jgi:hypothetical protein
MYDSAYLRRQYFNLAGIQKVTTIYEFAFRKNQVPIQRLMKTVFKSNSFVASATPALWKTLHIPP